MGRSAKIRHRRRRREQFRHARAVLLAAKIADFADEQILEPLQLRRRLPLGFVEGAPVDGVRQIVSSRSFDTVVAERESDRGRPVDELDAALAQALRDLDPDSASGLKPDT